MSLPHKGIIIEPKDKGYRYNYKLVASSLMKDPTPSIPNAFTSKYIHLDSRMTHYMITYTFSKKERNSILITQFDTEVVWYIKNKIKVN